MEKAKKFDSIQMMREIREKLGERYWKNPEALKEDMKAIRQKYKLRASLEQKH